MLIKHLSGCNKLLEALELIQDGGLTAVNLAEDLPTVCLRTDYEDLRRFSQSFINAPTLNDSFLTYPDIVRVVKENVGDLFAADFPLQSVLSANFHGWEYQWVTNNAIGPLLVRAGLGHIDLYNGPNARNEILRAACRLAEANLLAQLPATPVPSSPFVNSDQARRWLSVLMVAARNSIIASKRSCFSQRFGQAEMLPAITTFLNKVEYLLPIDSAAAELFLTYPENAQDPNVPLLITSLFEDDTNLNTLESYGISAQMLRDMLASEGREQTNATRLESGQSVGQADNAVKEATLTLQRLYGPLPVAFDYGEIRHRIDTLGDQRLLKYAIGSGNLLLSNAIRDFLRRQVPGFEGIPVRNSGAEDLPTLNARYEALLRGLDQSSPSLWANLGVVFKELVVQGFERVANQHSVASAALESPFGSQYGTIKETVGLVWTALHDNTRIGVERLPDGTLRSTYRTEAERFEFVEAGELSFMQQLFEAKVEYGSSASCAHGTFIKLVKSLSGIHPDITITVGGASLHDLLRPCMRHLKENFLPRLEESQEGIAQDLFYRTRAPDEFSQADFEVLGNLKNAFFAECRSEVPRVARVEFPSRAALSMEEIQVVCGLLMNNWEVTMESYICPVTEARPFERKPMVSLSSSEITELRDIISRRSNASSELSGDALNNAVQARLQRNFYRQQLAIRIESLIENLLRDRAFIAVDTVDLQNEFRITVQHMSEDCIPNAAEHETHGDEARRAQLLGNMEDTFIPENLKPHIVEAVFALAYGPPLPLVVDPVVEQAAMARLEQALTEPLPQAAQAVIRLESAEVGGEDLQSRFIRRTNLPSVGPSEHEPGPYGTTFNLPRAPVVFPYHPVEDGNERVHEGYPTFSLVAKLPSGATGNLPPGVTTLLAQNSIDVNHLDILFCVQNRPWQPDVPLLLRPHAWLHPEAPEHANANDEAVNLDNHVLVGLSDIDGGFSQLALLQAQTHSGADRQVVYSPSNMPIRGLQGPEQTESFYSLCINPETGQAAITLHWLLNDADFMRVDGLVSGGDVNSLAEFQFHVAAMLEHSVLNGSAQDVARGQRAAKTPCDALNDLCHGRGEALLQDIPNHESRHQLAEQLALPRVQRSTFDPFADAEAACEEFDPFADAEAACEEFDPFADAEDHLGEQEDNIHEVYGLPVEAPEEDLMAILERLAARSSNAPMPISTVSPLPSPLFVPPPPPLAPPVYSPPVITPQLSADPRAALMAAIEGSRQLRPTVQTPQPSLSPQAELMESIRGPNALRSLRSVEVESRETLNNRQRTAATSWVPVMSHTPSVPPPSTDNDEGSDDEAWLVGDVSPAPPLPPPSQPRPTPPRLSVSPSTPSAEFSPVPQPNLAETLASRRAGFLSDSDGESDDEDQDNDWVEAPPVNVPIPLPVPRNTAVPSQPGITAQPQQNPSRRSDALAARLASFEQAGTPSPTTTRSPLDGAAQGGRVAALRRSLGGLIPMAPSPTHVPSAQTPRPLPPTNQTTSPVVVQPNSTAQDEEDRRARRAAIRARAADLGGMLSFNASAPSSAGDNRQAPAGPARVNSPSPTTATPPPAVPPGPIMFDERGIPFPPPPPPPPPPPGGHRP